MNFLCACGGPAFAIRPGQDAVYAHAEDGDGAQRVLPILIARAVPDVVRCLECMLKQQTKGKTHEPAI